MSHCKKTNKLKNGVINMDYIYKIVDKVELDYAKDGILSLSHPIFEFKGSEGEFINFAKSIYDKYQKNDKCLDIKPSETDLKKIKEWIDVYKKTYGPDFKDVDINSESMIIFCGIMQAFCGYYTTKNLLDKEILREYLKLNGSKLKNKIAVIKINAKIFNDHHWHTDNLSKPFIPYKGVPDNLQGFNGFTHPISIVYKQNYDDYNELLSIYNGDELRHSCNWFNNLSKEYEWQSEYRLVFLLNSLEKNSSRIGCPRVYKYNKIITKWEELVYCNLVDAINYCQKGPRFIYINVGKTNIESFNISEIVE